MKGKILHIVDGFSERFELAARLATQKFEEYLKDIDFEKLPARDLPKPKFKHKDLHSYRKHNVNPKGTGRK